MATSESYPSSPYDAEGSSSGSSCDWQLNESSSRPSTPIEMASPVECPPRLWLLDSIPESPSSSPSPNQPAETRIWQGTHGLNLDSIVSLPVDQRMCYYPGLVHGGLLTTLLDEAFARCCSPAVTANLHVRFLEPVFPGAVVTIRVRTLKAEKRKIELEGRLETEGHDSARTVVEARALFVIPKSK